MFESLLLFLENLIRSSGAEGVFFATLLEEIIAPIPSILVLSLAGLSLLSGVPSQEIFGTLLTSLVLPAALGFTLGSLVVYGIFYVLGKPGIERFGKYFGVSWDDIDRLSEKMRKTKFDDWLFFFARATPFIPAAVLNVFGGIVRWRFSSFVLLTFFGSAVRAGTLGYLGYTLGPSIHSVAKILGTLEQSILFIILAALLIFFFKGKRGVVK